MPMPLAIVEWVVWANLREIRDVELLIVKGHLTLDAVLSEVTNQNLSFLGKARTLEDKEGFQDVGYVLVELNNIRNKLAHEIGFDSAESDVENWAEKAFLKFNYTKFCKITRRTRIIHAFSAMAAAVFRQKQLRDKYSLERFDSGLGS